MDNISILSWNVRGLNSRARQDNVRTLVADIRPAIVALQETKLDVIPQRLIFSMLGASFRDFAYLPASSTRGGILIAGRQPDVSLSDVLVGCYSVTVRVRQQLQGTTSQVGGSQQYMGLKQIQKRPFSWRSWKPFGTPAMALGGDR